MLGLAQLPRTFQNQYSISVSLLRYVLFPAYFGRQKNNPHRGVSFIRNPSVSAAPLVTDNNVFLKTATLTDTTQKHQFRIACRRRVRRTITLTSPSRSNRKRILLIPRSDNIRRKQRSRNPSVFSAPEKAFNGSLDSTRAKWRSYTPGSRKTTRLRGDAGLECREKNLCVWTSAEAR